MGSTGTASCVSCAAPLNGEYCSACGEERFSAQKRTLRYFFGHIVATELLNFDGKFLRTLKLLLARPGFLTEEYAWGRRRPYLHPFRLLLIAIVAFALPSFIFAGNTQFTLQIWIFNFSILPTMLTQGSLEGVLSRTDRNGVIEDYLEGKLGQPVGAIPDDVADGLVDTLAMLATPLSFTVVILLGALLFLLFNRRRPYFVEHLAFAMHFYSFVLFLALAGVILMRVPVKAPVYYIGIALAQGLWQLIYLAGAVRRFYLPDMRRGLAWLAAIGVGLPLCILSGVFITAVQLASGLFAVWLL